MTGGDSVNARHPYGRPFSYTPEFKVTLTGNTKPQIRGQDFAIWRRVRLIHFDQTITDKERIEDLNERLRAEASQILRLLVGKCLQWQQQGLPVPEVIKQDVLAYKEENDYMAVFIEEKCVLNDTNEVSCSELHQHYLEWAKKTAAPMLNITQFGRAMIARKGILRKHDRTGRKVYTGIMKAVEY
jgi:putative DNA primase/helicase